jgi:large subunit ribosomal protein L22
MEIRAHAKFIRMSPRKVKLVADLIRGLSVDTAETQLKFTLKDASEPVLKLLKSAVANAINNFNLKKENLFVKTIFVNEGPMLKRFRPRAFGRAGSILKRMCHITIVLEENAESKKIENNSSAVKAEKTEKSEIKNQKSETNSKDKKTKLKTVKKTV